jgi:hypothetical protein
MDYDNEIRTFVKYLTVGFFIWFVAVTVITLELRQKSEKGEYFYGLVIIATVIAIILLECFVF